MRKSRQRAGGDGRRGVARVGGGGRHQITDGDSGGTVATFASDDGGIAFWPIPIMKVFGIQEKAADSQSYI